jgi:biopolymer transport protein ExbD
MKAPVQVRPTINVTPLVDVVLVLLIIFMVVTPMMEAGLAMDLPRARHPEEEPRGMDPALLSVGPKGEVFLDSRPVSIDALPGLLEGLHKAAPGRRVVLQSDRDTEFRHIRRVFRMCQDAGLDGMSLRVNQRDFEQGEG